MVHSNLFDRVPAPVVDTWLDVSNYPWVRNIVAPTERITITHTMLADAKLVADGYHLRADSPAIDSGGQLGPGDDIDGQFRPQGARPDIGADEYFAGIAPQNIKLLCPTIGTGISAIDATVSPDNLTRPVTYTMTSGNQPMITTRDWMTSTLGIVWGHTGTQTIVVTASNPIGSVYAKCAVNVVALPVRKTLPVMFR